MTIKKSAWRIVGEVAAAGAVLAGFAAAPLACLNRPIEPVEP